MTHLHAPNPCASECVGPECGHHIDGIAGSLVHRTPVCSLAVIEANHLIGKPEMTQAEVSRYLGLSDVRINQIEREATAKMRRVLKEAA